MIKQPRKMYSQSSAIYAMAFIGALIYFMQHAHTFWEVVVGFFKAVCWSGVLIYKLL